LDQVAVHETLVAFGKGNPGQLVAIVLLAPPPSASTSKHEVKINPCLNANQEAQLPNEEPVSHVVKVMHDTTAILPPEAAMNSPPKLELRSSWSSKRGMEHNRKLYLTRHTTKARPYGACTAYCICTIAHLSRSKRPWNDAMTVEKGLDAVGAIPLPIALFANTWLYSSFYLLSFSRKSIFRCEMNRQGNES